MIATEYVQDPAETLEAIKPILRQIGVTRLADLTGMDCIGVPCYASIRPDSQSLAVDSGKGLTKEQAKCSAAMESIERWALDEIPIEWYASSQSQTTQSRIIQGGEKKFPLNRGAVFTPEIHHRWAMAKNLEERRIWIPYYTVKLYEEGTPFLEKCFYASTNGMAAGVTREETFQHALHEVVERDSVHQLMVKSLSGQGINRIDLETIDDQESCELIEKIRSAGANIFIYDCRSEVGLPVFKALIADESNVMPLTKGYGAHYQPELALRRTICEACQSRCVVWAGARDDITWAKHQYLIRNASAGMEILKAEKAIINYAEIEPVPENHAVERLTSLGHQILTVDFPLPWKEVVALKVLVSGLAGYWEPYAAEGRPQ